MRPPISIAPVASVPGATSPKTRSRRASSTRSSPLRVSYPFRVLPVSAVFQVLVSVALLALIMMHSGRDSGMGGMGFTPASQGGTHIVERNLTRVTVVLAILFFANCVVLFHLLR